jgi:hypothetical protein
VPVVAVTELKTLTIPFFCATKTRPSAAKRTAVGWSSPEKTVLS